MWCLPVLCMLEWNGWAGIVLCVEWCLVDIEWIGGNERTDSANEPPRRYKRREKESVGWTVPRAYFSSSPKNVNPV